MQCHRTQLHESSAVQETSGYMVVERSVKEQLTPRVVERMFELDFSEKENGMAMSQEDREFLRGRNSSPQRLTLRVTTPIQRTRCPASK